MAKAFFEAMVFAVATLDGRGVAMDDDLAVVVTGDHVAGNGDLEA